MYDLDDVQINYAFVFACKILVLKSDYFILKLYKSSCKI